MYGRHEKMYKVFVDFLRQISEDAAKAKEVADRRGDKVAMPVDEFVFVVGSIYQAAESIRALAESEAKEYLVVDLKEKNYE